MGISDADFGVQVGFGFVGRVVGALVAFLGSIVLARVLGPSDYGMFYLLLSIVAFLDNPTTGWAEGCRKRLTEVDFPSGEALGSVILGVLVSSVIVSLVALPFAPWIAQVTGSAEGWFWFSILFAGMVVYHTANEVLISTDQFGTGPWLNASRDVIRVLGQATLVLIGFGVAGMVWGMVIANILVAPVVLYVVDFTPEIPSRETLGRIWTYARYSIVDGIVGTAQHRMDRILLGLLASSAVVGNYEVAMKLTLPAMFVAGVAQDGLMGRISNVKSRGEAVAADVQNNLGYASLFGIPLFFGALTMSEPIIVTLYSNQYAAAAPYLIGLALFRLIRTQQSILVATINGLDNPNLNLRVSTGVFAFNLIVGLALLYIVGPLGVVYATVASEIIDYAIRAWIMRSLVPMVDFTPRPLLDQLASGAFMAIVVYGARLWLPLSHWPYVALVVAIGGITYAGALVALSSAFRETVLAVAADAGLR